VRGPGEEDSSVRRLLFQLLASEGHYQNMLSILGRRRKLHRGITSPLHRVIIYRFRAVSKLLLTQNADVYEGLTLDLFVTGAGGSLLRSAVVARDMSSL